MNIGFEEVQYENFSVGQHIYKYVWLKSLVSNGCGLGLPLQQLHCWETDVIHSKASELEVTWIMLQK